MLKALRLQQLSPTVPQFVYYQARQETQYSQVAREYIKKLDLQNPIDNEETRALNTSLSYIRASCESKRRATLLKNPLLARMRLSDCEPPVKTTKMVTIRAELRAAQVAANMQRAAIQVSQETKADQAIATLFENMMKREEAGYDLNPEEFCFTLQGTDEVIAGVYPLNHFVCVRQFLVSGMQIMDCLLVPREGIVTSITEKELAPPVLGEPLEDQHFKPITVTEPPSPNFNVMPSFPHTRDHEFLSIFVGHCVNITSSASCFVIKIVVLHGTTELCKPCMTRPVSGGTCACWNQIVITSLQVFSIPREARLSLTLYNFDKLKAGESGAALGTLNFPIYTYDGWFNSGMGERAMWNGKDMDTILTTCENQDPSAIRISFSLPKYRFPISFVNLPQSSIRQPTSMRLTQAYEKIQAVRTRDALQPLTTDEKTTLWNFRYEFANESDMLPYVISSIDFTVPAQVQELPIILHEWNRPPPAEVLCLLNAEYADQTVREYAVDCLEQFSDSDVMLYMLQLVQALKYENYDNSALLRFLFRRGIEEPKFVGHQLFWQLMSEAHLSHIQRRFSLIVVNFLYGIGSYTDELLKGYSFTQQLVELNKKLSHLSHSEALGPFQEALAKIEIPKEFHLPMDPRLVVESFIIDKCKVMNSKKKPFWLTFKNAALFATEPVLTMFKVGDDLRQDQLTLQVMKVMEHLWQMNDLDLQMRCYGVLPTGYNQGFVEVVPHARTEGSLQQEKGAIAGAFSHKLYYDFLMQGSTMETFKLARTNFKLSNAGYAVATCVLGVADRHPDNIMIQSDGHFFHIDFGHFLGNFKKKLGYQREDAPFHYSAACDYLINFEPQCDMCGSFEQICSRALNVLRKNSKLLITLFMLMLGTGIPELQTPSDISYIKDKLFLNMSDEEAGVQFAQLIQQSLQSNKTIFNNICHNVKVK